MSYGTRLALTAMRDHPEGIRSVILDSTYPPQVDGFLEFPSGMVRALNVLFDSCRSDAACARAYPDLERTFLDAVARLNEEPVRFDITHPLSGQTFDALYNGDSLVGLVFQSLYSPSIIPLLPEAISDTVRGLYGTVAAIEGQLLANNEFSSTGMYYSVQCAEEARFVDEEAVAAENARYPEYLSFLEGEGLFRVCDEWGAYQAGPIENEPVASNIPTLVLAGGFDPITPPSYGRRAADTLSRSFFFEVPSAAHGVANDNDCTRAIALAFVDDPLVEPDAACIRGLAPIGFTVLETEVALTSYTDAVAGFATRVPADWEEVQPGFYARTQIGATFLLVLSIPTLAVPFAVDDFADLASAGAAPVPTERTIGDVEWRIYEIESGTERTSVGAGDLGGGDSAIVLFRGPAHVVDVLHTPVFVAAVENLRAN